MIGFGWALSDRSGMSLYVEIECLCCGSTRLKPDAGRADAGECPCCHYLGWEYVASISERERALLRAGGFPAAAPAARRSAPQPSFGLG